jgi:NAD(P)-dependent dehydrogenase (short-subunit alcohol dehydrogenase family)
MDHRRTAGGTEAAGDRLMTLLLEGKVALITGGSRGLGRALCHVFAREGATVAFNYAKHEDDAQATLAALKSAGHRAFAYHASVLDKQALRDMVRSLLEEAGHIDILVNNAGVGQVLPLALMEEEDWDRMFDVHVKGAFLTTHAVMRTMVKQQNGQILNISSLAGVKMMEAPVHYSAAKAALKGMTEALAKEVGRYGIRVNCLAPGLLEEGVSHHLSKPRREDYLKHCALGRIGTTHEVAEVAAFLVSDRNRYMSGATIVVDGAV